MARRFTRIIGGRERQVRQNLWLGINDTATVVAGSTSTLLTSLNAAALALRPFTIVRTRLRIFIESDQAAASELMHAAYGRMVVSDQAAAAGTASVPAPLTNTDAPWYVWEALFNKFLFGDATGFLEPSGTMIEVDSKAMRKVGNNEDVVSVIEMGTGDGGAISQIGRSLIKLH